jgi:hypothetical protein
MRLPQISMSAILRRAVDALAEAVAPLDAQGMKDEALNFGQYRVARPAPGAEKA